MAEVVTAVSDMPFEGRQDAARRSAAPESMGAAAGVQLTCTRSVGRTRRSSAGGSEGVAVELADLAVVEQAVHDGAGHGRSPKGGGRSSMARFEVISGQYKPASRLDDAPEQIPHGTVRKLVDEGVSADDPFGVFAGGKAKLAEASDPRGLACGRAQVWDLGLELREGGN